MYQIMAFPMTLSVIQGRAPIASLFKSFYNLWLSYSCAAVDNISAGILHYAVPLQ